ncbi:hypothetical protein ABZX38_21120 [Streptomyces longwoodensis]
MDADMVTLQQTGALLDRPVRLVWQAGTLGRRYCVDPTAFDAARPAT